MAKGDATGSAKSASGTGVPKQDQYSVMHSIMDNLTGAGAQLGAGIAPTGLPRSPDQGQMGMTPNSNNFATNNPIYMPQGNPGTMGGRFGAMNGVTAGGAGSLAPSNPQDMLRRTMTNKGTYGG